mmetsp:Transcript_74087/g.205875  ORF Transcript_74087/g.205875 Transcript_74087/m.205875 type:complete len:255 (-) Transcript_74087:971-1735(-)
MPQDLLLALTISSPTKPNASSFFFSPLMLAKARAALPCVLLLVPIGALPMPPRVPAAGAMLNKKPALAAAAAGPVADFVPSNSRPPSSESPPVAPDDDTKGVPARSGSRDAADEAAGALEVLACPWQPSKSPSVVVDLACSKVPPMRSAVSTPELLTAVVLPPPPRRSVTSPAPELPTPAPPSIKPKRRSNGSASSLCFVLLRKDKNSSETPALTSLATSRVKAVPCCASASTRPRSLKSAASASAGSPPSKPR